MPRNSVDMPADSYDGAVGRRGSQGTAVPTARRVERGAARFDRMRGVGPTGTEVTGVGVSGVEVIGIGITGTGRPEVEQVRFGESTPAPDLRP